MARYHNKNWERARKHFNLQGQSNMILHHKDVTLKERDFTRYLEWRVEDLEVVSRGEHTTLHHKGKSVSLATKKKIAQNHVGFAGRHHTEETRRRLSECSKGVPKSAEARKNIRENHARLRGKDNPNSRKVLCVELNQTFCGTAEASRVLGISQSGIVRCCNKVKNYNTAGGYHWRYMNDIN